MPQQLAMLAVLAAALAPAAGSAGALWAEGEAWYEQVGSRGTDRPPFASRGECLGCDWGGRKGDHATYRFRIATPIARARLHIRYARRFASDAIFALYLDGRPIHNRATFPSTGGWGHARNDEWAFRSFPLGRLTSGWHELRLVSLAERNNTNIDGFFISGGPFQPPRSRSAIERAARLAILATRKPVAELTDPALTIEEFCPMASDVYYPPEEGAERAALRVPAAATVRGRSIELTGADGRRATARLGERALGWEVVAVATVGGRPAVVLERRFRHWGLLAYVGPSGPLATIRLSVGRLDHIQTASAKYPPDYVDTLLKSRRDILGRKVLRRKTDPSFEACAAFLPEVSGYTFLSTETSPHYLAVEPGGAIGTLAETFGRKPLERVLFDPCEVVGLPAPRVAKRGLVGGWLPAIDYGFYDPDEKSGWEEVAFCASPPEAPKRLDLYVHLRTVRPGDKVERLYFKVAGSSRTALQAGEFFARLAELKDHWERVFANAMTIEVPERRLADASRASLARAFVTYEGAQPRYGVGHYSQLRHATFPPTTLSMVNSCITWGLLDRAGTYLDYYLDHVVRPDGTFDYYGPAVSEYGQMLAVIARYVRCSRRFDWLRARRAKIESIVNHLLALRRQSQAKFPKSTLRHGLVFGSPEADTRDQVNYYFSGDAWTWRGWTEIAKLYVQAGNPPMKRLGRRLLAECRDYRADIENSIRKSITRVGASVFVPPIAGFDQPFKTMTQDTFASYTNYRYWVEMLSSGFLPAQWHDAIIDYRVAHGGELLGITRFGSHLDDWPYAGYAYGLLLRDRVRHFLLGFYGDLALHRTHGTFTAFEQVAIRDINFRPYVADYCVPAQLVTPLLVRWMLVFEEPDADVLWLCRATPRRWLSPGKSIKVRGATTRWGRLGFAIERDADGSVAATIELPRHPFPAEVRVRLRLPGRASIRRVTINGKVHEDVDPRGEFIRIVRPRTQRLRIVAAVAD